LEKTITALDWMRASALALSDILVENSRGSDEMGDGDTEKFKIGLAILVKEGSVRVDRLKLL